MSAELGWFYCEMLGHSAGDGQVREITVAGMTMRHITVPCDPPAEIIIPPTSLFRLSKIDEANARKRTVGQPAHLRVYEAPALPTRAAGYYVEPDPFVRDDPGNYQPDEDDDTDPYDEDPDPEDDYDPESKHDDVETQPF